MKDVKEIFVSKSSLDGLDDLKVEGVEDGDFTIEDIASKYNSLVDLLKNLVATCIVGALTMALPMAANGADDGKAPIGKLKASQLVVTQEVQFASWTNSQAKAAAMATWKIDESENIRQLKDALKEFINGIAGDVVTESYTKFSFSDSASEIHDIAGELSQETLSQLGIYDAGESEWTKHPTKIVIGNKVTSIGNSAFFGCSRLTNVTIGDNVTSIGSGAFYDCTGLANLTMGNSVTNIGIATFYGCSRLMGVKIPDSVTSIGNSAFEGCTNLTSLTFQGKTLAQVQEMDSYPWGISDTSIIIVE